MTRPRSAHATSYRDGTDWRERGICRDDPDGWDIDVIGVDTPEARQAVRACKACPVLAQCREWTEELASEAATRPRGLVQAGLVFAGGSNGNTRRTGAGKCRNGHDRAEVGVYGNGECALCAQIRYQKKRAKEAV